jgi:hypothetical protein
MRFLLLLLVALLAAGCPVYGPDGAKDGCATCHDGIEDVHTPYVAAGRCSTCHGGDATTVKKDKAHVPIPADWASIRGNLPAAPEGFIKDFAPDQLDRLPVEYLQFINPGDIRAAGVACGGCHADHVASMPNSVMSTNAGHYFPTLLLAGLQDDQLAHYGSVAATDPDCDPVAFPGTVCALATLTPADHDEVSDLFADGVPPEDELLDITYRSYLSKKCNTCHQAGYPRNNSPGLYRSSGCSSCHFVYDKQGVYLGGDPTIPRGTPVHAKEHVITTAIPAEQCATCHFQGGRIGLLFRGIREGGFGSAQMPPNAETINETLYGHAPGYYVTDEDTTNSIDETPPDAHYAAGMHCSDCHVGRDVHGDGRLYSSSKMQVTLRCEDCHGTPRAPARPNADGDFVSYRGNHLTQLRFENGQVLLRGKISEQDHVVPQPSEILQAGQGSAAMVASMAPNGDDWSHADSLTCDTCHTSHTQFCIGCHVSVDLRFDETDYQTGARTPGLARGSRTTYSLDSLLLGTAPDGRIQTVHPSQQLQMAVYGSETYGTGEGELLHGGEVDDGEGGTVVRGAFRSANGFDANIGFAPLFQHTTTANAKGCAECHRSNDSADELTRVRGVYGFGTGEFMLQGASGEMVDGLQFLDADGNDTTKWHHAGTGPASEAVRDRALGVILNQ